ncbi:MAG: cation diffusion facilitator family transporter [Actinomycetota bacterium]
MTSNTSSHSDDRKQAQRVAFVSLLAALGLVIAKLAAGLATGSLAILSEAAHSALDAGVTALTFAVVRIASRPPDHDHPYGHGKAENISALIETIALFALSAYLAFQAVSRLRSGSSGEVDAAWYGFAVIGLSMVVDANRSRILRRVGRKVRSPALEADALNFTADMLTSFVVLVGLAFVKLGYPSADAIGSLLIAAYVGYQSVRLGRKSVDALMDRAPSGSIERITEVAKAVPGVQEVRRVRVRYTGGEPQTDVVIAVSRRVPLEKAHEVTQQVERAIAELEPGADVIVHVEPLADEKLMAERIQAISAREPGAGEIHNIFVTAQQGGLHVSMHVKFPGAMTLTEAHSISEKLEKEIREEIPGISRIDTHLEPLGESSVGTDVTEQESRLAGWATSMAEEQPEVNNCHELVVTDTEDGLTVVMHCEAAPGLSVNQVHEASTRIETETHRRWPEVRRVTVHFEPAET